MAKGQMADVRGRNKAEREFHKKWLERQKQKAAKQNLDATGQPESLSAGQLHASHCPHNDIGCCICSAQIVCGT